MTDGAGRFELIEALGTGGVAEVWRARDATTGQEVALKLLLPQLADDRQVRRRFLREAEVARRLDHPGIVRILDAGDAGGRPFLAMELVRGEDLGRRMDREGRLPPEESWRIAIALAEALGHAHARGIVHRDVKPQNVLLEGEGVKLADFGLARVETLASLTGSSLVWGSPEYMAPELFTRGRADPRTDLFSLGVVIHEMVTGRLPWKDGRSPARIAGAAADAPPLRFELGQGEALDRLVSALLSPSPDDRPSSAVEVVGQLRGDLPVAPLVRSIACPKCGHNRPEDVPRCFACGHEDLVLRHTTGGGWDVLLLKMKDDATSMEIVHTALSELVGRKTLKLKFLLGAFHSKKEQAEAIKLPAVLFSELDEATAREIASRLVGGGVRARAAKRKMFGRWTFEKSKPALIVSGGISGWMVASMLMTGRYHPMIMVPAIIFGMVMGGSVISVARELLRTPGRFRLRARAASTPEAERLLGAAQRTGAELTAPEVRALFVESSRALFRLTRRAEELATAGVAGSSEEVLARKLLAAAPALVGRLESAVRRLETLDAALEADSEGETLRALSALERRRTGAAESDRAALDQAGRELEAALDRRLAAETEREQLAASLCRLLATVRDLYHRAAALTTAEERETAAIEEALLELEAEQRMIERAPAARASSARSSSAPSAAS